MTRRAGGVSSPDAVVVGAGHHGLVAANRLVDAGWDVVVCEATDHLGGAVHSDEGVAPGFVSDVFSAFYPLAAASPVLGSFDLGAHGLRWVHAPAVLASVFTGDDRAAVLSRDEDATAASVEAFAPGDGDAWRELVAEWRTVQEPLLGALFEPFPPVRSGTRLARALGLPGLLRFARFALLPARRLADERFHGVGAKSFVTGNAMHADLAPEAAGSGLFGWLLCMLGQTVGFPSPEGGAAALPRALGRRLTAAGGEIRTGTPVERVVVEDGVAVGVRLRGGEFVRARRAVIADVNAPTLYRDLVGEELLPPWLRTDLERFEWDTPTIKIDWALSSPIPWTATGARGAGTVHVGPDPDTVTGYAADLARLRVPADPFVLVGQMTTADPTRSPAGTESAWAYTHLPPGADREPGVVDRHADRVQALLESVAPGFSSAVIGRRVLGPGRFEVHDPNLVGGTISGGTEQPHQQLVFRPVPGLGGARTVVDRLYLASASAHPGGGVHGACGSNAATAALGRSTVRGVLTRRAVEAAHRRIYR